MGELFAPLLGWFFGLVGQEAKAAIYRKRARERRLRREAERRAAIEAELRRASAERQRQWDAYYKRSREIYPRPDVGDPKPLDPNPYGDE